MTCYQAAVDHLTLPSLLVPLVNGEFFTMPWLDGRNKPVVTEMPDGNIARTALRAWIGIAAGDFRTFPMSIVLLPVQIDAGETGRKNIVALVAVPIDNQHAVLNANVRVADQFSLPFRRPIKNKRN